MTKIEEILAEMVPDVDYAAENLVTDGLIDSIDIVGIIAELEASYNIKIPPKDIDAANFESVNKMQALVDRLLSQKK